MATRSWERDVTRLVALAGEGLDLVTFWREADRVIGPWVPHFMGLCWFTLDPASLLITSHWNAAMPELPPEVLALEYDEDDVHDLAGVARSAEGTSTLHDAAGGDPARSPRWRANVALGGDQELIVALRTARRETWGALTVYRAPGQRRFGAEEIGRLRRLAPTLAEGARRALLLAEARYPEGPDAPGVVVLSPTWSPESTTPGAERWIEELPGGDLEAGRLPPALLAVAGRAMREARRPSQDAPGIAVARVRTRSGGWAALHGVTLGAGSARRAAVIVERAHPAKIAPLLMSAYGLTEREQELTGLVLRGESTATIAARLAVSPHTVQQHLKGVFEKTGVRSRRDLVGKVFFAHYEPRVRDNEARAAAGLATRGGPAQAVAAAGSRS